MTLQELEAYFQHHTVAPGTMLNPSAEIEDPRLFLETNFNNARQWKGDLEKCPNYWHLRDLHKLMTAPSAEEFPL